SIAITADNGYELWVNGRRVGGDRGIDSDVWSGVERFAIEKLLLVGANVIAVRAENLGGPAGLLAAAKIELEDGRRIEIATDASWLVSTDSPRGFTEADHDDSLWRPAAVLGPNGIAPWGRLSVSAGAAPHARRIEAEEGFRDDHGHVPWPRAIAFLAGSAPDDSDPAMPQTRWPIRDSKAFFEYDAPAPAALGRQL